MHCVNGIMHTRHTPQQGSSCRPLVTAHAPSAPRCATPHCIASVYVLHRCVCSNCRVHYQDGLHGMVKTAHPAFTEEGDVINLAADFTPWWDGAYMVGGGRWAAGAAGGWVGGGGGQRVAGGGLGRHARQWGFIAWDAGRWLGVINQ